MRKSRYTEEQIISFVKQAETRLPINELCRKGGLSDATFYKWRASGEIIEIAHARRRFDYRRIHDMLRPEYPQVNHKWVYPLYSEANLAVRRRKKARRPPSERVPLQIAHNVKS